jgi:hypothetical protein
VGFKGGITMPSKDFKEVEEDGQLVVVHFEILRVFF